MENKTKAEPSDNGYMLIAGSLVPARPSKLLKGAFSHHGITLTQRSISGLFIQSFNYITSVFLTQTKSTAQITNTRYAGDNMS